VLNLDNNLISDLSNLTGLSLLAVLRLNHNRIESLGPDKPVRAGAPEPTPTGLMVVPTRILCWNLISPHLVSSLLIPSRPIPSLLIRSHLILISSHRLNRTSPHLTSPHLTSSFPLGGAADAVGARGAAAGLQRHSLTGRMPPSPLRRAQSALPAGAAAGQKSPA